MKKKGFRGVWVDADLIGKNLSYREKILLGYIRGFKDGCFASDTMMGEILETSRKNISNILSSLQQRGFITVVKDGKNRTIFYADGPHHVDTQSTPRGHTCPHHVDTCPHHVDTQSTPRGHMSTPRGFTNRGENRGAITKRYQILNQMCSSTDDDTTREKKFLPTFSKNEPSEIPPSSNSVEKYCLKKIRAFQRLNEANPRASKIIYAQLVETFEDREQDPNEKVPLLLDYLVSEDDKSLTDMASLVFKKIRVQKNEKYDFFLSDHIDEILTTINESC